MATCKDCLHFEVCDSGRHIGEYNDDIDEGTYTDGVEKECPAFKNKADVAEVKHGEWKRIECGTICTNCNRVYDNDFEFSYKQIKQYFKRCPDCGAKMDGDAP